MMTQESLPEGLFPSTNTTLPFWRTELHELDSHRSTSELPSECDILIIGAGYAGITQAYHLLNDGDVKQSVVLLDARQACSGATARNGGHLRPRVYRSILRDTELYGAEAALEIIDFEIAHLKAITEIIDKEDIDCDFVLTRSFDVSTDETEAERVLKMFNKVKKNYPGRLTDVQYVPSKYAENVSGFKDVKGLWSFTAAHLWPYKLFMAILQIAVNKGLNLQTNTPVTKVSSEPDADGYWNIETTRGSIKARNVVFATNGYTAGVAPQYAEKIVPSRGICSRIIVPEGKIAPHVQNTYGISLGNNAYDYLIPRPDGSIIVGGARSTFFNNKEHWYNVVDDGALIEPAKDYFDGYMQKHFVGWEDSDSYTDRVWTGIMGYTSDSLPHIGEVPGKKGQFIAAGFNGHGMPNIFLSTKGIAKMINQKVPFEETGIPRAYKTTQERLDSARDDLNRGLD